MLTFQLEVAASTSQLKDSFCCFFPIWTIIYKTIKNIGVQVFVWTQVLVPLGKHLGL